MGRYIGAVCRLCRREGVKLFLKGKRCETDKCAITRERPLLGEGTTQRPSVYGIHFREKQKLKRIYGIKERQLKKYVEEALRKKGNTGEILLQLLERRLDNVVYRLGVGSSRKTSRQIVSHGHILVNGKKLDIPSYLVIPGDKIKMKDKSKEKLSHQIVERKTPSWLAFNKDTIEAEIITIPKIEEIALPADISTQLVIEFYSK